MPFPAERDARADSWCVGGGAWRVWMGWGTEARGTRHAAAAGGSGRQQAAGGRGAPDEASTGRCRSGPARTSRASRRRSAPRVCTRGWSVVEMERGGAVPAARRAKRTSEAAETASS
eukprot:scaffold35970_cov21-Phaeocystis_antarctica.AAC.1